ncbi:type VI secretion system tube protein Hcp [Pelomonas sp. KK5]|uniref:type VI secretion system tube protein Hcp n=1 Tax=Pelomonas sp. KK5 TaxID=1855730 RepID=UPI00097C9341|nr:type VI secretion system tube protein Hcp [Pelomonas sp. KK5]
MAISLILLQVIDGGSPIEGACTLEPYQKYIVVDSFDWSVEMDSSGDLKSTKLKPKKVSISKHFDAASTKMYALMEKDPPFEATLRFIDPAMTVRGVKDVDAGTVMKIELKGCHIESVSLGADDSGKSIAMTETITFSFEESLMLTYNAYSAKEHARKHSGNVTIKPDKTKE